MAACTGALSPGGWGHFHYYYFLILCFTSYFVFSIAVLPHSPGVVYYGECYTHQPQHHIRPPRVCNLTGGVYKGT